MSRQLYMLMEDAGAMGRYQILQLIAFLFSGLLATGQTLSFVFTTTIPDIICPDFYNDSDFTAAARAIANDSTQCGLALAKMKVCSNWTYDTTVLEETIVSKYNLSCDEMYMVPLSTTFYMCGFFIGSLIYGYISDRFGRLKAIAVAAIHAIVAGFLSAFSPTILVYLIARLLTGAGATGVILVIYSYLPECSVPRNRGTIGMMINVSWSISLLFLCFLTYFLRRVTSIDIVLSSLTVLILPICAFFRESPRWLHVEGHLKRLRTALKFISRFNGRELKLKNNFLQENINLGENLNEENQDTEQVHVKSFFIHPGMRRVSIIVWYISLTISLVYYGLSNGFSKIGGWSIYVNMGISASLEVLGILFISWLLHSRNRIPLLLIGFGILTVLLFLTSILFAFPSLSFPAAIVCLLARSICAIYFSLITIYVAEVYPTTHRTFGLGISFSVTRLSAMIAPFVHFMLGIWKPLPFLVYGGLIFIAVLLYLLMPETHRRSRDTVAQAEVMMKRYICAKCLGWVNEEDDDECDA